MEPCKECGHTVICKHEEKPVKDKHIDPIPDPPETNEDFEVKDHFLFGASGQVPFSKSPSQSNGIDQKLLVFHYTAGPSFDRAVRTLTRKSRKASAHLVIGRDGQIAQLVSFDKKAWHAGKSVWPPRPEHLFGVPFQPRLKKWEATALKGLNRYSIGIELVNSGKLKQDSSGEIKTWYGKFIPRSDIYEDGKGGFWHAYPEKQMDVVEEVAETLVEAYGLEDIMGHEDVSPRRKIDPGPAFQMDAFKARVLGRDQDEEEDDED